MTNKPQSRKCDGNHGGPRCHDPECWNDAALEADEEGVLFGYMDRSVRVSQEAYAIFLDRERALEAQVAALSQQAEPECEWPTCECALEPERCKQAEPAPAAVPDSSDTFYAGLYKKSAPMWHRLHDLAVSKGYDHVRFAIECAPVYRCDCMGARKVAIDTEGNTIPCECVTAANEAERAPARSYKDDPRSAKELSLAGCNCVRFGEGNRHWPCSIHAAPAQDEREARALFEEMALIADDERCVQMLAAALATRPAQTVQQPVKLQHMAYSEDGVLRWMTGRKIDNCELYAMPDFGRAPKLYAAPIAQTAPQPEQSGWISVEDRLPEVAAGDEGEFIVCVYRSHNGESYSFSARFLNDYPLHTDYEDEPALHSGWYDVKEHADYDGWYSPLIDEKSGDKVTHWMPLPAAPAQGGDL